MAFVGRLFVCSLLFVLLAAASSEEPECPLVNCVTGAKVACLIDDNTCSCRCVFDEDPCASLIAIEYLYGCSFKCTVENITCKCGCST